MLRDSKSLSNFGRKYGSSVLLSQRSKKGQGRASSSSSMMTQYLLAGADLAQESIQNPLSRADTVPVIVRKSSPRCPRLGGSGR
jgi:hypothetical protein